MTGSSGGSQIIAGREDFACGSSGISTLCESFEIELSNFEVENAILKGNYLRQVVEIVIGGVPTVLEVCFICVAMSLGRILLQLSIVTNLFDSMGHQVDPWNVEVGI